MVVAGVQFKIMPENLEVNLETLKADIQKKLKSIKEAIFNSFEEKPIAFGLKALILTFALPESEEVDLVQNEIQKVKGVSSVELIDYRRAVG